MLFYIKKFRLARLGTLSSKTDQCYTSGLILIQGANLQLSKEQGDTKIDFGSTKIYFGEHQENNLGSQKKRVKFLRESGDGGLISLPVMPSGAPWSSVLNVR